MTTKTVTLRTFNAATAFVPWRTSKLAEIKACSGVPSMRPRPSCRGEPGANVRRSGDSRQSFNAATAFVPWRTSSPRRRPRRSPRLQCGHGLRAVENEGVSVTLAMVWQPSMRPRPSCRGELRAARNAVRAAGNLQCGHGLRAVENAPRRRGRAACERPSMRPRPSCRGELQLIVDKVSQDEPSMRPRPSCRGEPRPATPARTSQPCLQCGHGLRAVENDACPCACRRDSAVLQCGHGLRAVENQ